MTAKKTAKKKTTSKKNEVAVRDEHAVGAVYDYGEHAGGGFQTEDSQNDIAIPFLNLLQAKSPEVEDPEDDRYIDGAKAGMFINSLTKQVFDEVLIIPVVKQSAIVEWVPRDEGGGWVGAHQPDDPVVKNAKPHSDPKKKRMRQTADGHDLVDTVYLYCLVVDSMDADAPADTVVLSFTSTKLKKWRAINTQMRMVKGAPPRYAFVLRLKSVTERGSGNTWKNYHIEFANGDPVNSLLPPDSPLFQAAVEAKNLIETGAARADFAASNDSHAESTGSSDSDIF